MRSLLAIRLPASIGSASLFTSFYSPWWLAVPLLILFVVMIADCMARYGEYLRLRNFIRHDRHHAIIRMMSAMRSSWCSRIAASTACIHEKVYHHKDAYTEYKWYHIFPDGVFQLDSVLFKKNWWLATLGIRRR